MDHQVPFETDRTSSSGPPRCVGVSSQHIVLPRRETATLLARLPHFLVHLTSSTDARGPFGLRETQRSFNQLQC